LKWAQAVSLESKKLSTSIPNQILCPRGNLVIYFGHSGNFSIKQKPIIESLTKFKFLLFRLPSDAVKVAVCLTLSLTMNAQYRVDKWTTDDGLPQNSVTGLTQTRDGYIWLTTNDGLVRFDGARFQVFNKSNTPELTTNRLVGAFEDKSGRLWFQTEDGGIVFYEKGRFKVGMKPNEVPSASRSPFFDDQRGGVIFYVNHQNYRYSDGKFVPVEIEGLPEDGVIVLADRDGGLWFKTEARIHRVKNGNVKTYRLDEFSRGEIYTTAYEDRQGGVWLSYVGENNQSLLRIKNDRVQSIRFPASAVCNFAEDIAGNLWISVYKKGIYRIDKASVVVAEPTTEAIKPIAPIDGISTYPSGILCPDREGGMWIGTEKGLVHFQSQTIQVFSEANGLPEDNVYPIYEDSDGSVWAGIWDNSLVKYENGNFKTVLKTADTLYITSLFEDRDGRFWFGNIGGLHYLNGGHPVKFSAQAGFPGETEFSVISQDREGNLWFGTSRGLSRYNNGQATVFTKKDGLPDDYVVAFLQTRDGKIWVGTRGGIASIENEDIKSFTTENGLASNYVRSLYEDAEGVLWIGSYDGGLTRFRDGSFTRLTMKDGLSSNGVFCILEDSRSWFWINSNQGIYRVSRQELNDFADGKVKFLTSIAYNKQDGLLNVEGNGGRQPAGIKTRDGRLWFPTAQGIAVVDPETVIINPLPPPVLIEQIVIDRNPVDNETYQSAIGNQSAIKLAPNQNNLEINYTGLSFINSEQVKFRYRLVGLENDWNEVGIRRTAYYSYLPSGEYTFQVIAANRDGVWNTTGASVRVKVLPPFYRTWWFLTLCAINLIALVFLIYRYRVGQFKKKSALQEDFSRQLIDSQEIERGRIAAELHDGLSQSLVIIKNRAMLSLTKPDDQERALEQLREIADASTFAIDEVKDIIYDLRPIQLDRLGLTGAVEDMVEKVAEANELELIRNIADVDNIFPKASENSIYRIVQELLNNIVKHSAATKVEVIISKNSAQIELIIKDNGKGFPVGETNKEINQKSGFGLIGIVERAKLLGGIASIKSAKDAGTTILVILPIRKGGEK
jgi:signal transduction histidine kinase/ligand-binding sensor domain-containing protein